MVQHPCFGFRNSDFGFPSRLPRVVQFKTIFKKIFVGAIGMDLQEIGEFGLINRIRRWATSSDPALVQGIGDDVAVIGKGLTALLVTTDILIEDIHFDLSWTDPYTLGRKSLAVNLSDIASMGGTPKYFLISIGLPKNLPLSFVSSFYQGLKKEAKRYQVELIGGDTSLSQKIVINICLLGAGRKRDLLYRRGARLGDGFHIVRKDGKDYSPSRLGFEHIR